ncbi:MAG TPA: hypothetical protein VKA46_25605 [Gemmataceae bacterium]|nr:hypothetical protein [Gemmataceae bacterium]
MISAKGASAVLLAAASLLFAAGQSHGQTRAGCAGRQRSGTRTLGTQGTTGSQLGTTQQSALLTAMQQQQTALLTAMQQRQQLIALLTAVQQQQQLTPTQQQQVTALLLTLQQQQNQLRGALTGR